MIIKTATIPLKWITRKEPTEREQKNRRIIDYIGRLLNFYSWVECGEAVMELVERITMEEK